jgi:hypothetical protein
MPRLSLRNSLIVYGRIRRLVKTRWDLLLRGPAARCPGFEMSSPICIFRSPRPRRHPLHLCLHPCPDNSAAKPTALVKIRPTSGGVHDNSRPAEK